MYGWISCGFSSLSTIFQSFKDDGKMIMKGIVQCMFMFEKNLASSRILTRDPVIRNFCLDILNSGPIQRVGREKTRGAMEDVDSSIYETVPGTNILTVHFISMRTLCVRYSRKTRSPSQFLVVKNFLKI